MALHIPRAAMLMLALALVACQTIGDVTPGQGQSAIIAGHPYDRVWDASLKVAERHFAIREPSKPDGVILAERTGMGGGWIGIYLTAAGADTYRVEVVRLGKYAGQLSFTNWPRTALREIQEALGPAPAKATAPAKEAPAKEAPPKEAPAQEAPAKEAPAQEAPAEEAPAEEAPPKEAPTKEAPAKEAPAQEAPAKEAPAQEAPAKEAPAQEAPPKEAPAKEAPAQ